MARTGLDPRPHLPVYFAYNFFRLAAILQGIAGRVRDGTATSAFAAAKAEMVRPLAAKAWEFAPPGRRMKTFALALGAGGARGLAHIAVIEALDEMGVKPAAIAGTSIGALDRRRLCGRHARQGHPPPCHRLRARSRARPDGACLPRAPARYPICCRARSARRRRWTPKNSARSFCRMRCPKTFPRCEIPLTVIATDLHRRQEAAFSAGPLRAALAASIAFPGLFRPVSVDGRVLVDGGATNPLPFDRLLGRADIVVAVDVFGVPAAERSDVPGAWESMFATLLIMASTIVAAKYMHAPPDLVIRPNVAIFRTLDFYRASAIIRSAEAAKPEVKEKLGALLGV